MPTLIKFFAFILFVAVVVLGTMVALPIFVQPTEKEVIVTVPTRDLLGRD